MHAFQKSWASSAILAIRVSTILIVLLAPLIASDSNRFFTFQMIVAAYLAVSFDLAHSYGKVLSFTQGLFFAVGAYAAMYTASDSPWGLIQMLLAALGSSLLLGSLVGSVLVRMNNHNATISTVILASVGFLLGNALSTYTGGEDGLHLATRSVGFLGLELAVGSNHVMYYLAAIPLITFAIMWWWLQNQRVWKVLRAVAQNETRAQQLGFNVNLRRTVMFTLSAGIAGLGGAFYVLLMEHVTTTVLDIGLSVNAILWAVVGGLGTAFGPLLGVLVVYPVTEVLATVFVYVQILVGLFLVVVAIFFPSGIIGTLKEVADRRATDKLLGKQRERTSVKKEVSSLREVSDVG